MYAQQSIVFFDNILGWGVKSPEFIRASTMLVYLYLRMEMIGRRLPQDKPHHPTFFQLC